MSNAPQSALLGFGAPIALAIGLTSTMPSLARAQEYCIGCAGPDAVYRCVIEHAVPAGPPLKSLCLNALTRQQGHASCNVRKGTVFDCDGPIRRVDGRTGTLASTTPEAPAGGKNAARTAEPGSRQPANPSLAKPQPDPVAKPANAAPRTVEEAARNMTKSSGEALGNAGNAIADTTRKAWGCVTSLFKSC